MELVSSSYAIGRIGVWRSCGSYGLAGACMPPPLYLFLQSIQRLRVTATVTFLRPAVRLRGWSFAFFGSFLSVADGE